LEKVIIDTWSTVPYMNVREEDPPAEKVVKLNLAINESKNTLAKIKFKYEVHIFELQIRV